MSPEAVTGLDDPRITDYVGLTDVALRSVREPVEGIFIAEGAQVIERALAADYRLRSVLGTRRFVQRFADDARLEAGTPVLVADEELLRGITGYRVHRGALASFARRPLPSVTELLDDARRIVLLHGLKEHTNVGAVIRSAAAFGVDAVICSADCADPLYRRSIKVSMGTVFQVPWTVAADDAALQRQLADAGFVTYALTPDPRAEDLDAVAAAPPERIALLLGTEGPGLDEAAQAAADRRVRIPMGHGVDSLNVAAAAAVACFALRPR